MSQNRPYSIRTHPDRTRSIRCLTCHRTSFDEDDVYYRYCAQCGFLGDEVRWKWIDARAYLRQIVNAVGRYKKVKKLGGETWHAVPTERIATEGLKGGEVEYFPLWTEEHEKTLVPQIIDTVIVLPTQSKN